MITLLSALLLVADTPADAASATAQTAAAVQEPAKEEKKICKREMATESRMASKRVCLTAAQWRERQTQDIKGLGLVTK